MTKTVKSDNCWSCGHRLDQPHQGRGPERCGCGDNNCVVCPNCGKPLCACPQSERPRAKKQAQAEKVKGMARGASQDAGSSGGSGGDREPHSTHLPAVDPFPVTVFPPPLQDYIHETARAFGCPPDYVGVSVLAVAAAAIGDSRAIEAKQTFQVSPSIYAAIVGPPGSTKSPVFNFVSRPVDQRQEQLLRAFKKEWAAHTATQENSQRERAKGRKRHASEEDSPDPSIEVPLQSLDRLEEPVLQRITTSDTTVEALCLILAENPRGLLLKRDELVAWVRGMDMYRQGKGTDRQFYLSGWSGAPFVLDRKSNKGRIPVLVPRCFLVVVGCLTPDLIGEFADERGREDGFLDRILWTYPDVAPFVPWSEDVVSDEARARWVSVLERLWALKQDREGDCVAPLAVGMTTSAKQAWVELYDRLGREAAEADFSPQLSGIWSKLKVYGARLTLILHQLRLACGEARSTEMVDDVSVHGAAALVDYFRSHALRIHAVLRPAAKLPEADAALIKAVEKLVATNGGKWSGPAKQLLQEVQPHAGAARGMAGWPASPESMGRAIRRVAGNLKKDKKILVELPRPTDKTRILTLRRLPEPPNADGNVDEASSSATSGPPQSEPATAQTAQPSENGRAVQAGGGNSTPEPPMAQSSDGQGHTDISGGSGGSGGCPAGEPEVEEGEL